MSAGRLSTFWDIIERDLSAGKLTERLGRRRSSTTW
jgi:hypothetical protein